MLGARYCGKFFVYPDIWIIRMIWRVFIVTIRLPESSGMSAERTKVSLSPPSLSLFKKVRVHVVPSIPRDFTRSNRDGVYRARRRWYPWRYFRRSCAYGSACISRPHWPVELATGSLRFVSVDATTVYSWYDIVCDTENGRSAGNSPQKTPRRRCRASKSCSVNWPRPKSAYRWELKRRH